MKPTVSIIVPVYNAEEYLHRCIDSIVNQEYKDFELLLMDDGSTDSSPVICDEYAAKDNRVRVIHKENTGVSDTRNLALDLAQGTYIQFLDSDDWITPEATKLFVRAATETDCDLVIADFYRVVGDKLSHKGDIDDTSLMTREEFAGHMMENPADFYYGVLWNKLYKREIIETHKIRMEKEINWCEDFIFNMEYFLHANTYYALQAPVYYYLKRKGSLVAQGMKLTKVVQMKVSVFEYYHSFYKNVYDEKEYSKRRLQVYRFLIDAAGDSILLPSILPGVKKLGKERTPVDPSFSNGTGILFDNYRHRKLMDRYLEVVAFQHDLTLKDIKLLYHLNSLHHSATRKDLADFMGVSSPSITVSLQKLIYKNLIAITDMEPMKITEPISYLETTAEANPIIADIKEALDDYETVIYSRFTAKERDDYGYLHKKMQDNIKDALN